MSWLFGSKKTKTTISSPSTENKIEVNEEDDFLVVNKPTPIGPTADSASTMYPNLSDGVGSLNIVAAAGNHPLNNPNLNNPLQGVPFKLSKVMGLAAGDRDPIVFALYVQSIVDSIDFQALEYDFGVERGVAREY